MKSNFNKMINRLSNQEEMANFEKEIQKLEKEINSARKKLDYLSNKVNEYEYKSLNLARENNVMIFNYILNDFNRYINITLI